MVQVDVPAAFAMGQVYALIAKQSLSKEPSLLGNRFITLNNWYVTLILAPVGLFLLVGWPGWETMYRWSWVESVQFHPFTALFYILFLAAMVIIGNAGFIIAHRLYLRNKDQTAKKLLVVSIIISLSAFLIDINAPFSIGTFEEYHNGESIKVTRLLVKETEKDRNQAGSTLSDARSFFIAWFFIMLYWVMGSILMGIKFYWDDKFLSHQKPRIIIQEST